MSLPKNPYNPGTQISHLYNRLTLVPYITRKEIHKMNMDTARIREIRYSLRAGGMDIKCEHIPGVTGDRLYTVVGPGR